MKLKKIVSVVLCALSVTSILTACSLGGGSDEAVFRLKELPDIGEYQTDEIKSYYHKGPVGKFMASEDYGMIVPFISEVKTLTALNSQKNKPSYIKTASYGFATADGKIIVDGLYSKIDIIESKSGETVYAAERFIKTAEDNDKLASGDVQTAADLIAADGSWVVTADRIVTAYPDGNPRDYVQVYKNDSIVLYDFSGNEIFDESKAIKGGNLLDIHYAKDGKIILESTDSDGEVGLKCVDSKGEILAQIDIGDYGIVEMIGGVFVLLRIDGREYFNLCDLNGSLLLEKDFERIECDNERKTFVFFNENENFVYLYGSDGKLINKLDIGCRCDKIESVLFGESGIGILCKLGNKYVIYNAETGEEVSLTLENLSDKENAVDTATAYTESGKDSFMLLNRKDGTTDVYNSLGTYVTSFSDYADSLSRSPDGDYCYRSSDNKFIVRSHNPRNDFEIDFKVEIEFQVHSYDEKYLSFSCQKNGGDTFYKVYDIDTKELAFDGLSAFEGFEVDGKTYYSIVDDSGARLVDSDLNELISTEFSKEDKS